MPFRKLAPALTSAGRASRLATGYDLTPPSRQTPLLSARVHKISLVLMGRDKEQLPFGPPEPRALREVLGVRSR